MKICAVIAEYNPFHNGHLKQIEYIKQQLPDTAVIAIMSGNIVQRGELAVLDKYTRAHSAVLCGVDAVLELPYPWCGGSAGYFAKGAVDIAKGIGAHYLCFGSESGDMEELKVVAARTCTKEYIALIEEYTKNEPQASYITLSRKAYKQLYGECVPEGGNNTLAVEYLKYIGDIIPLTYKRTYPSSATAARGFYRAGDMDSLRATVPSVLHGIYKTNSIISAESIAPLILWQLCNAAPEELCTYADADMGIACRIQAAAKLSAGLEELYKRCATKKYTDSRVRRVILNMILGTQKHQLDSAPQFTALLSANERGRKAVRQIKKQGNIKIITKPADHMEVREQFMFSNKADTLFALAQNRSHASTLKKKTVIL